MLNCSVKKVAAVLVLFSSANAVGADDTKETVRVVDGDTLEIGDTTFRINGIDAPEFGQECQRAGGGTWPCGKEGLAALVELTKDKIVVCNPISQDGYGRSIATCYVDGADIGARMVLDGWAWAFARYFDVYVAEQAAARDAGVGVWQAETMTAWEYRENRWAVAEQEAPKGCPIKGNISSNGRIYHPPWSPWYSRTKVSVEKGERWFCSEAEAVAAGWRAPRWN